MLPPDDMHPLWFQIGITPWGALGVVIATVVLYLVYAALMRWLGPRLMSAPSVLSFTLVALFGAIAARAMMGNWPTLGGALVAIAVLVAMEALLGRARWAVAAGARSRGHGLGPRPIVVVVHGHVLDGYLRRRHLTRDQLHAMLRRAGVRHLADVELAILENRGTLTVVRTGERIDASLLADVDGSRLVPRSALDGGRPHRRSSEAPGRQEA